MPESTQTQSQDLALLDRALGAVPEYEELTELDRKILAVHTEHPEFSNLDISRAVGCAPSKVWTFMHSDNCAALTKVVAAKAIRELRMLAVQTLRKAMLQDKDLKAAVTVATKILQSEDIIHDMPKNVTDNRVQVLWKEQPALEARHEPADPNL